MENLLTNAVKYGAKDELITVIIEDEPKQVIIKVSNKGKSINPEDQKNIFNFLQRSENDSPSLQSWGMGLTFVKMAAEAHRGTVEVESAEGKTTFTVILKKYANQPGKKKVRLNHSENTT